MTRKRVYRSKKKLGQAPGSIVYTGERSKEKLSIETFDYSMHHCYEKVLQSIQESFEFKLTDSITWINLNGLNHVSDIEALGKHYELHPLVLEDIVNIAQRPKIDEYQNYLFVVLKMLYYDGNQNIVSEQVSFILGENCTSIFE